MAGQVLVLTESVILYCFILVESVNLYSFILYNQSWPGASAGRWPGGGWTQRGGGRVAVPGGWCCGSSQVGRCGRAAVELGGVVVPAAGVVSRVAGTGGGARPGGGWWRDVVGGGRDNFWVFEREEMPRGRPCGDMILRNFLRCLVQRMEVNQLPSACFVARGNKKTFID
jgi:hypothetical protein